MGIDPEELQKLPPLRGFPAEDLAELVSLGRELTMRSGAVVMEPGTIADHALLLVSGRLSVSVEGDGGRERSVGDVWPGEIVGESAFFPGPPRRMARVRVVQGGTALALPSTFMEDASGSRALLVLQGHLISTLARRIRSTDLAVRKVWQDQLAAEKRAEARTNKQSFSEDTQPLSLSQRLFSIFGVRS